MPRYNHAMTLAFEVLSDDPEMPSLDEIWEALQRKVEQLRDDPDEREEALMVDLPFDTYIIEG